MSDERTPLLQSAHPSDRRSSDDLLYSVDHHHQFCHLVGIRPRNHPPGQPHNPPPEALYCRARRQRRIQNWMYQITAVITNNLMLSQIVLGATLTGLSASNTSHILVAVLGALNTIIAGVIAFLKSRGQPMRARMYRDDLERVVDDIENSAIMWLGISKNVHGYDAIDTDDQVTVRGEVARLTRLYDKAVKTNTLNDPDMYATGGAGDLHSAALRDRSTIAGPATIAPPAPAPAPATETATQPTPAAVAPEDPDAAPATKPPEPEPSQPKYSDLPADGKPSTTTGQSSTPAAVPTENSPIEPSNGQTATTNDPTTAAPGAASATGPSTTTTTAPLASTTSDPDESPATAAHLLKHSQDTTDGEEKK